MSVVIRDLARRNSGFQTDRITVVLRKSTGGYPHSGDRMSVVIRDLVRRSSGFQVDRITQWRVARVAP